MAVDPFSPFPQDCSLRSIGGDKRRTGSVDLQEALLVGYVM